MSRPKGSKNNQTAPEIAVYYAEPVSGSNTIPQTIVISNLKYLPKNKCVEYNWFEALSPEQAAKRYTEQFKQPPEKMYAMIRWFIPAPKEVEK